MFGHKHGIVVLAVQSCCLQAVNIKRLTDINHPAEALKISTLDRCDYWSASCFAI